ncbi:pyrimidine operon attenuation protein/uracil phosphoribosyltransferase [Clostridium tetanomorphum]|uniref:Bifunctional protein PyrR n=1 Tax=Clostridium tetanomorphum TaxID=1553 RepID=A0A923E9Z1_CLOTT|nr:bifunctional pyr operon transcriptional regulator/uracil phosphoribosyltransferase PyrR [Clostridium tetanomorphum]KAJ53408.1 bifunctional pyrimidine regulatory protein PyrR uracil phosphoribosyltransferase [Clostridium tetanomorphum DSM 665]MBC2396605.1 bifunctional pyr operon transcriptional regulator/uracil phosphoribosyltransferase PyrR [Clostridium tetanomorphum]MBP1863935.1 pyrimidine operon attenuation protein/uracil phosphoribosyltransferase [Clostridium tetanomorphum]NRS85013.1 pyri
MKLKASILDEKAVNRALVRISHEIVEKNKGVEDIVLIGVKRRGEPIANRIAKNIESFEGVKVPVGSVDITLYRDDLTKEYEQPHIISEKIDVDVKDKNVIIVDDVIYTGRTVRAAIDAIFHNGRPKMIQLAVMVDRGHRELPIRADYVGKNIPTSKSELVSVEVAEIDGEDAVKIFEV